MGVHKNGTNQTVTASTQTLLTWTTEVFDTNNNFASNRFTPTVSGKYLFYLNVRCSDGTGCIAYIKKNGNDYATREIDVAGHGVDVSAIVDMNGSTDYIEAYVYDISGTTIAGLEDHTYFTGALIAPVNATAGGWQNDGTQSILADSTDKVGIGTSTPWSKLSIQNVYGSTLASLFSVASSTSADGSSPIPSSP
jgi:hypothetical protein